VEIGTNFNGFIMALRYTKDSSSGHNARPPTIPVNMILKPVFENTVIVFFSFVKGFRDESGVVF